MAKPLSEALTKLMAHIQPIADQLGVREVNPYAKAMMERVNPPVIDLVLMADELPKVQGVGSQLIVQHRIHFRLWFYSEILTAGAKYQDVVEKLEAIQDYLIKHLNVDNGYGDIGLSDSDDFAGLNIEMGEIFGSGEAYLGGYIDISMKVQTTY